MADGGECDTSHQTEEEPTMNKASSSSSSSSSPAVIEIVDSTTECEEDVMQQEKAFVSSLHSFMKDKGSPIERIPHLGFKQINLWRIYKAVEKRGGYDSVTTQRLWKKVYDELGGSPGSTSAATCTRRHYERLVLPFERHIKGEEDKPLPPNKPRKPYKRNSDGKVKKVEVTRKRSQSDREMDSETHPQRSSDALLHPHPALWTTDRPYPDRAPVYTLLSVPLSNPWTPAHVPSATAAEVISPLEKKKRMAQASLSLAQSPKSEDKDRPSVICRSQSPASPSHDCCSSDGSPQPPSSSSSRSPSPLSVSSEDGPTGSGDKPASSSEQSRSCALGCGRDGQSRDSAEPHKETSQGSSHTLTADSKNCPVKDSCVRELVHKGSSKYYSHPFQPIPTSSFTKVIPKAVPLLRPAPVRPGYKIHQNRLAPQDELQRKVNSVTPWVYPTEKRDKSRTMLQKVPPTQQSLTQSTSSLPLLYVLSGYDKSGRDSRHLPPMHPMFLPSRMRFPQSPFMYRHIPLGPVPTALTGSAVYPYPYSVPLTNNQTGYTLPSSIYPHKL